MEYDNYFEATFPASSVNEGLARIFISGFLLHIDPYVDELSEIKTAVSEAVTNAIIHGYDNKDGEIRLFCGLIGLTLYIEVSDYGIGILDIERAMEPLYTSKPREERTGLGFTVMENFSDSLEVISTPNKGTTIKMKRELKNHKRDRV